MAYIISEDCIPCLNCIPEIPKKEFCYGSRYNFKKGMEYCQNAKECKYANNLVDFYKVNGYKRPEVEPFFFYKVKDFRNCKKYLELHID